MILLTEFNNSEFIIVGPGLSSREDGLPFMTDGGKMLRTVFSSLEISPNYLEFNKDDYEDEEVTDSAIDEFKQILENHKEIKYVIYLGRTVASKISPSICKGMKSNVLQDMGFLPSKELGGLKAAVIYHPLYIYKQSKDSDAYFQYVSRIKSLIFGDNKKCDYNVIINKISMKDFVEIMPDIENQDVIAFDYETNSAGIFASDFKTTIVSFAVNPNGSNDIYSWWIPLDEGDITPELMERYHQFIKSISEKLWAYNCTFEMRVNQRLFNEFIGVQDAMVLMVMNSTRDTLKTNVRRFLNADFWESDVHYYIDQFNIIFKALSGKRGCSWDDIKDLSDFDLILNVMRDKGISDSILEFINEFVTEFSKESFVKYLKEYPYGWGSVPRDVLGPYCAYDSAYTIPLVRMFYNQYSDGYPVYIRHMWLAAKFMMNGIRWNDDIAETLNIKFTDSMRDCLYYLIQNLNTIPDEQKLYAKEIIGWSLPHTVITYTKTGKEKKYEVLTESDRIEWLKTILNPNSNTTDSRKTFWDAYYTDEVEISSFVYCLIDDMRLKGVWDNYLLNRLKDKTVPEGQNAEYWFINNLPGDIKASALLDDISQYIESSSDGSIINQALVDTEAKYKELTYGRYSTEVVNLQYQVQKLFFNININDPSTWTDTFALLYNLQYYKKLYKTIGTSINGANGRANVYEVNGFDKEPVIRQDYYRGHKDNQNYLIEYDFNPLGVATHRWSSPFHTIVAGSPLRKALIPRNKSGVWYHCDFSQAELVVLAFFSQDPDMMNVYLNRGDMHKYIASKIFEKPQEDITSDERRASKSVEFGIIYGKSVENTAVDVTGGDVAKAQALFDSFYGSFPGIKTWMDQKRIEVDKFGYVTNLFGGKIAIDITQPGNGRYRQAINYPIQSTSSMIAGVAMYNLVEYCENHGIGQLSYGFTHDSLDISTHINDIFDFMDAATLTMEKRIYESLGAPMHIDIEVGVNGYQLVGIEDVKRDGDRISFTMSGVKEDTEAMIDQFNNESKWRVINIEDIKTKEVFSSAEDMFMPKGALKDTWGKTIVKKTYNITLQEK